MKWFESSDSSALEKRLRQGYEVNGQTAWSLLNKAERYRVYLVSDLPVEEVKRMRMVPAESLQGAMKSVGDFDSGFILPRGAGVLPRLVTH